MCHKEKTTRNFIIPHSLLTDISQQKINQLPRQRKTVDILADPRRISLTAPQAIWIFKFFVFKQFYRPLRFIRN